MLDAAVQTDISLPQRVDAFWHCCPSTITIVDKDQSASEPGCSAIDVDAIVDDSFVDNHSEITDKSFVENHSEIADKPKAVFCSTCRARRTPRLQRAQTEIQAARLWQSHEADNRR